ncbi:hypothetical protein LJC34_02760 [Oscillospiraceae bacterium OttesenSCG-928-G22]|nr:hypothetical protein [Oscillospiraceae bacterium OttesenSCG-928-G22]
MKKYSIILVFIILITVLAGCGGLDSQIDEIKTETGFATVHIKPSFNWHEKTDDERQALADFAVQKCLSDSSQSEELRFVYGYFGTPRETVFIYHVEDFPATTINADLIADFIAERDKKAADIVRSATGNIPHISGINLLTVEKNVAYYDAFLISSTAWDWDTASAQDHYSLIKSVIAFCGEKVVEEDATSYEVSGYTEDGHLAFMWRGGSLAKIYIDGKYDSEYNIGD